MTTTDMEEQFGFVLRRIRDDQGYEEASKAYADSLKLARATLRRAERGSDDTLMAMAGIFMRYTEVAHILMCEYDGFRATQEC